MRLPITVCTEKSVPIAYRQATQAVDTHRRFALSSSSVRFFRRERCFGFGAVVEVAVAVSALLLADVWEEVPFGEVLAKDGLTSAGFVSPAVAESMANGTTHQSL